MLGQPRLVFGRVVRATIPDPQGRNPKNRKCVVISRKEDIDAGGPIRIVGVTSTFVEEEKDAYVPVPYGPNCLSGFDRESAALCNWVVEIPQDRLEVLKNLVRPDVSEAISMKIDALGPAVVVRRLE